MGVRSISVQTTVRIGRVLGECDGGYSNEIERNSFCQDRINGNFQ